MLAILGFHLSANEGVSTTIDVKKLEEVKDWVENSKYTLDTELDNILRTSVTDHESLFIDLIERLLSAGNKPNEFMMRNILYRTQIVYKGLQTVRESPKRNVLARRILQNGLEKAQGLYEPDLNLIKASREGKLTEELRGAEFAKIGVIWADYMLSLYYLAPTNEVKLQLMKDMIGLMYNDILNDDSVNRILAPIANAIAVKHEQLDSIQPRNKIEILLAARDLRRFAEQQLEVAKRILTKYNIEFPEVPGTEVLSEEVASSDQDSSNRINSTTSNFSFRIGELVVFGTSYYTIVGITSSGKYKIKA